MPPFREAGLTAIGVVTLGLGICITHEFAFPRSVTPFFSQGSDKPCKTI
jgi:hypothetical protein